MDIKVDEQYIKMCFTLARNGLGEVSPNPLVGSVIVQDNIIIGRGFHEFYGGPHAEPNAINNAIESVEGATLYCNLEPCCHTNKQTPPCTSKIIESKIKRVVISNLDPNPLVAGKGVKKLREAGIAVTVGVLEEEGRELNEVFFKYIQSEKPFVHIKLAQTLDGKIATSTGDSKWISSDSARVRVHEWRKKYDAILIGRNTLEKDDPTLNIRMGVEGNGKIPYRVVIGSIEKINLEFKLFQDENSHKTIIATTKESYENCQQEKLTILEERKVKILLIKEIDESLDLDDLLQKLGALKITSVLVEGGQSVITSFIDQRQYDKLSLFICPKIIGNGISYYRNDKKQNMKEAIEFTNSQIENLDGQIIYHTYSGGHKCLQD
ncbi:bifunctional diaminohydroxyphosphoribosylaminopyrimidine deaminase/5-amino-6-(5-phosphoribosylamino)uracil reductase RibD [Halobacteriovorax sp. JY17]|uniref:bifunctional diaminohydroxyphosphoribosylaminopyrimidine deaminase/5-amino-6-(5-phosphoribosylamino)uracil reductase RibD n=1 Tax=Halobacteriovorax sp. JY17 TaxID=2014617 RepID=UPI000C5AA8BC|nr:bifunctional diaminohydroxyphosphoribosylaminopyrimidine deaminase/5-amino-6-(5-phosphoribosylamino)uracil reductase RibD [Halobacteriovorax sp. JY17]PIK14344.1 MAG: riboflavin biosynthesis protein RibD [Halobacteriovorax sp. JY17]